MKHTLHPLCAVAVFSALLFSSTSSPAAPPGGLPSSLSLTLTDGAQNVLNAVAQWDDLDDAWGWTGPNTGVGVIENGSFIGSYTDTGGFLTWEGQFIGTHYNPTGVTDSSGTWSGGSVSAPEAGMTGAVSSFFLWRATQRHRRLPRA